MLAHHTLVEAPIRSISYLYVVWRDPILQRSFSWDENQWLQLSKFKISPPKIIQINLLGSQLNPHGLFLFLLIRYDGQIIVYYGALGIIAHGIL